jgi:hypothetical protein
MRATAVSACTRTSPGCWGIVDRLKRKGLRVRTVPMTATSKTAAYAEVRARLTLGQLELYRQPELLAELRRLRSKFTAGAASVVNPRVGGSHGDIAQALAIAVLQLKGGPVTPMRTSVPRGRIPTTLDDRRFTEVGLAVTTALNIRELERRRFGRGVR